VPCPRPDGATKAAYLRCASESARERPCSSCPKYDHEHPPQPAVRVSDPARLVPVSDDRVDFNGKGASTRGKNRQWRTNAVPAPLAMPSRLFFWAPHWAQGLDGQCFFVPLETVPPGHRAEQIWPPHPSAGKSEGGVEPGGVIRLTTHIATRSALNQNRGKEPVPQRASNSCHPEIFHRGAENR